MQERRKVLGVYFAAENQNMQGFYKSKESLQNGNFAP